VLTTTLVLVALGCASGLTTVLFGFGGGFVTVPVIYALAPVDRPAAMHVAVGTSAAVMLVNAAIAGLAQYRAGRLRRAYLWPLGGFIGIGAVLGACAALAVPDGVLHLLFALYLAMTIVDVLLRRGFLRGVPAGAEPRPLGSRTASWGGVAIGAVAAFLGVGGSVLTVPLLRRRGLVMAQAVAMANPLSVPIAAAATAVYLLLPVPGSGGFPGPGGLAVPGGGHPVDLPAAAALLAGSLPTIAAGRRLLPRLPDHVHAVAYLALLCLALLTVLL
jgi:uncharacterized protein